MDFDLKVILEQLQNAAWGSQWSSFQDILALEPQMPLKSHRNQIRTHQTFRRVRSKQQT